MASFGGADGKRDGLQITHLTDHDDVRVFTQGASEGVGEGLGVGMDLALGDMAALRGNKVFDRILEGDDVVVPVAVDVVDQRGKRCALAAAY